MKDPQCRYRFGVFELDCTRMDLYRDGRKVPLQPQPAQVLAMLVARAGQIVSRDDLRRAVWSGGTFVDFDRGLNFCIAQIRSALGDDAHVPRYVRTVPKRGYEFICPVQADVERPLHVDQAFRPDGTSPTQPLPSSPSASSKIIAVLSAVLGATAIGAAYLVVQLHRPVPVVAVARFDNETADPRVTTFTDALSDTVVERLTHDAAGAYAVIGNAAPLRAPRDRRDLRAIAASLKAEYIVLGQVQRDNSRIRVLAHLIHLPEQAHVMVSRTDAIGEGTLDVSDAVAGKIAAAFEPKLRAHASSPMTARR